MSLFGHRAADGAARFLLVDVVQLFAHGRNGQGAVIATRCMADARAAGQMLLDELLQIHGIALFERGAKRLTMVRENHKFVGSPGLVSNHPTDVRNHVVELTQRLERVGRPGTGMMGHFVVAGPGHIDRRAAADNVKGCQIGCHLAHEDRCGCTHEGIEMGGPVQARLHILALLAPCLPEFAPDIHEIEHEHTHEEVGVQHQEIEVIGPLFFLFVAALASCATGSGATWPRRRSSCC